MLIYKTGNFYNSYGDNAIIFNYLFGYKILIGGRIGFPLAAFNKVLNTLDNEKINYQIIYKDSEPTIKNFDDFNNYKKILKHALEYINIRSRVERIQNKINEIADIETLERILKVVEDELQ